MGVEDVPARICLFTSASDYSSAGVPTAWSAQGGPTHSRGLTLVSVFILIHSFIFNTGHPDTNDRAEQVRVAL